MSEVVVNHPEVDEKLYVAECVVRVGCPICKVKAGVPCKGARFEWLKKGSRRGFRYKQGTHYARRDLFKAWDQAGRPYRLPREALEHALKFFGDFPRKVDHEAEVIAPPKPIRTAKAKPASAKRVKRGKASTIRPIIRIEHKGAIWEGIEGNKLWSWMPYVEYRDYTHISVYDFPESLGGVKLSFNGHDHKCETREDAFDLAIELVVKTALLDVFNERAKWRVRELERRFGHLMEWPEVT